MRVRIESRVRDALRAAFATPVPWERWLEPDTRIERLVARSSRRGVFPPEFDPAFYRRANRDLAGLADDALRAHFEEEGREAGRVASPAAVRSGFLAMLPAHAATLEIGPFASPTFVGSNVAYFDVLDRSGLLRRAAEHNLPTGRVPEIDFVSPTGDLSIVPDKRFDCVFSSHCIEHQPDLIQHLLEALRVLRPNGRYFLIIPDKRYCFDHFIEPSGIDEVLRAHDERRKVHSERSIVAYWSLTTHNDARRHWRGDHEDPRAGEREARAADGLRTLAQSNGAYIDVHGWQFTPGSFRAIMGDLARSGNIPFEVTRVYDTPHGRNEFTAVLTAR